MSTPPIFTAVCLLAIGWIGAEGATAGVLIVSNETSAAVSFKITPSDGKDRPYTVAAGDLVPVPVTTPVEIAFISGGHTRRYVLPSNTLHSFVAGGNGLELLMTPLGVEKIARASAGPAAPPPNSVCDIPIMILADDDEPAVQSVWEKRFRNRMAAASAIFERYCRVRFPVAAVGTWVSDNHINDFEKSLEEFQRKVHPAPARLAVGFTSQYRLAPGVKQTHLGGTRGPLQSHILIREWPQHISEPERLEVLVHELGHILGAIHTTDERSVMRPLLGDGRSRARSFRIGFDPPNLLAMYSLGEELRTHPLASLGQLRPDTKARLRAVYQLLAKLTPDDPTATRYMALLDQDAK